MKLKRIVTMFILGGMLSLSCAGMAYAKTTKKQVDLESNDGKITAVGTLAADFTWLTGKGTGGAETAIDGDSDEEGRIFVSLFAINKKNEIVYSETKRADFYGQTSVKKLKCKKFTSYHQILNANDRPIGTKRSLSVSD